MKALLSLFAILLLALPVRSGAQAEAGAGAAPRLGTVYVFRSRDDDGGTYYLTYQTRTLAHLKSGTYTVLHLPEGRQYLLADPAAEQIYGFTVVAGAEHYVEVVTSGSLLRRHPGLVDSTAAEFAAMQRRLKEVPVRDDGQ